MAFAGTSGSGFGVLVLAAGKIAGADVAGAIYNGTYAENAKADQMTIDVDMAAPAGITPVQTGVPLAAPMILRIDATFAQADMVSEKPILFNTSLGPVNVVFKKIRDFP